MQLKDLGMTQYAIEAIAHIEATTLSAAGLTGVLEGLTASQVASVLSSESFIAALQAMNAEEQLAFLNTEAVRAAMAELSVQDAIAVLSKTALTDTEKKELLIKIGLITADEAETVSLTADTVATVANTAAKKGLTAALKGLWATMLANPYTALVIAAGAFLAISYKIIQSVEENKRTFQDFKKDADDAVETVKQYESQLEKNRDRIQEIKDLKTDGSITEAEEAELERLERQNELLEVQLELAKKVANYRQEELVLQTNKEASTFFDTGRIKVNAVGLYGEEYAEREVHGYGGLLNAIDDYYAAQKRVEEKQREINELEEIGDEKSLKRANKLKEDLIESQRAIGDKAQILYNFQEQLIEYRNVLAGMDDDDSIENLHKIDEAIELISDSLDEANPTIRTFEENLSDLKKKSESVFDKLSKGAKNFSQSELKDLQKWMDKCGYSVDDLANHLYDYYMSIKGASDTSIDTSESIGDLTSLREELAGTTKAIADYQSAMEGGEKGDKISSIADIYKGAMEDIKSGRIDTNRVHALAELMFSDEQLASMGYRVEEIGNALQSKFMEALFDPAGDSKKSYGQRFANYIEETFGEGADIGVRRTGANTWDFYYDSLEHLAQAVGMDEDVVAAFLDDLDAYGVNVMRSTEENNKLIDSFRTIQAEANALGGSGDAIGDFAKSLAEGGNDALEISEILHDLRDSGIFSASDAEIVQAVEKAKEAIQEIKNDEDKEVFDWAKEIQSADDFKKYVEGLFEEPMPIKVKTDVDDAALNDTQTQIDELGGDVDVNVKPEIDEEQAQIIQDVFEELKTKADEAGGSIQDAWDSLAQFLSAEGFDDTKIRDVYNLLNELGAFENEAPVARPKVDLDKGAFDENGNAVKSKLDDLTSTIATPTADLDASKFYTAAEGVEKKLDELEARMKELGDEYNALVNGNVDYNKRPFVTADKMILAGWNDFNPDLVGTTYTRGETIGPVGAQMTIDITPILEDGTVLTPEALKEYIDKLDVTNGVEGLLESDELNLVIHVIPGTYEENEDEWKDLEDQLGRIKAEHTDLAEEAGKAIFAAAPELDEEQWNLISQKFEEFKESAEAAGNGVTAAWETMERWLSGHAFDESEIIGIFNHLRELGAFGEEAPVAEPVIDPNTEPFDKEIADVEGDLGDLDDTVVTPTAKLDASGLYREVYNANKILDNLERRTVTVTTNANNAANNSGNNGNNNASDAASRAASVRAFGAAGGKSSSQQGGETLVNELGPELISDDGRAYIANGGKPGFTYLSKDAIVFTADETDDILQGKKNVNAKANAEGSGRRGLISRLLNRGTPARGIPIVQNTWTCPGCNTIWNNSVTRCSRCGYTKNAQNWQCSKDGWWNPTTIGTCSKCYTSRYASTAPTSGNPTTTTTQSNTPANQGGSDTPVSNGGGSGGGSGGSGGSSGSDGSSNSSSENSEEDLDWIEILLSRIEQTIDDLDKIVTSEFKTLNQRTSAARKEIKKTNTEISAQEAGYKRYMKQANSVGLDEKWAKLVRNGKIDISTIKDENLKEKIEKYQKWLISGHFKIHLIAGTP